MNFSESDGSYSASIYGKLEGLGYSSELGQYGSGGKYEIGNGILKATEGSFPVQSFRESSVGGHSFVGHTLGDYNIGGLSQGTLTLGGGSIGVHNYELGGASSIKSPFVTGEHYESYHEEGENKEVEGEYESGYDANAQSLNIHGDPHVKETTKAVPVHKTLKIPIHHPVHQAIQIPIPVKVPVPYAIKIPIPVQVEKTVNVPVEKVIQYPIEKPIPYKVIKKVPVPFSKPYPVPYPVYKVRYIYHTKKIHHGHHNHGHHY